MKLAINFLKKNFCTWPISGLELKGLSEFDLLLDLDLANNRLCPVHNIQAYLGKFSLIEVLKILTLGKLFKVKSQGLIWCCFS